MRQHGEGRPHVAATELVGDDVDHRVLSANRGRAAMKFGTCLEVRRPMKNDPPQRSQGSAPALPRHALQDRGRRSPGNADAWASAAGQNAGNPAHCRCVQLSRPVWFT